ncbi:MAG TPA: bifunctional nicotinamidase/pyrazinamidase [Pirellulales bacterium]
MDALIVVDVQNDFLPGGALAVPKGDQVVEPINALLPHFPLVVATQDWHPAEHGSFAANNPGRRVGELHSLAGRPQVMWPVHCVQLTHGATLAPQLAHHGIDEIVQKGADPAVDSYSGFFDNDRRSATRLHDVLQQAGVQRVFVCGLATDYCVKATALDARSLGYEVALIEDACRGVNLQPDDSARAIAEMAAAGVRITTTQETLTERLRPTTPKAHVMNESQSPSPAPSQPIETIAEGRFLKLVRVGKWEYAERVKVSGVVVVVAVTPRGKLLLVEQYRPPIQANVLELPAGLAGDIPGSETEALATAAQRELFEETGYQAESMEFLTSGPNSAGLTSETASFFLAVGVKKVSEGGGDATENIKIHEVPLARVSRWLKDAAAAGKQIDPKIFTALYFLNSDA